MFARSGRPRFARAVAGIALFAALVGAPSHADPGLICGVPRNGEVTISVTVGKNGDTHVMKLRTRLINVTTAEAKAELIALILDNFTGHSKDTLRCSSDGATVTPVGQNGWHVIGIHLERDSTYEDDHVLSSATPAGDRCLASLSGVASGVSPSGGQGFAQLTAFGKNAQVVTQRGMPAQVVEQNLMQQLAAQGLEARPATPADFNGYQLDHDANVVFIGPGNTAAAAPALEHVTTVGGLSWSVSDIGLLLDLGGMMYPVPSPAGVPGVESEAALRLEVSPAVMTRGEVTVRFAAAESDPVRITAFDASGRQVRTLFSGPATAGAALRWDGTDDRGMAIPSGVYFLRLETARGSVVRRMIRVS